MYCPGCGMKLAKKDCQLTRIVEETDTSEIIIENINVCTCDFCGLVSEVIKLDSEQKNKRK